MTTGTKSAAADHVASMNDAVISAVKKRQADHLMMYGKQTKDKDGVLIGSVFDTGSAIREELAGQFNAAERVQALKAAMEEDVSAALGI